MNLTSALLVLGGAAICLHVWADSGPVDALAAAGILSLSFGIIRWVMHGENRGRG